MAPIQLAIVPVKPDAEILAYCEQIEAVLKIAGVRVVLDARDDESFGFKVNKWEVKGVPLVAKIGMKEVEARLVTLKARYGGDEQQFAVDSVGGDADDWLEKLQGDMLAGSAQYLKENTRTVKDYDEFKAVLAEHRGFVKVYWNDNPDVEKRVKEETKATSRCRLDNDGTTGVDFVTGEPANERWIFAQSY